MKRTLRILAAVVLLATAVLWVATGANRGWTRTSEQIKTADPTTGLDRIEWKGTFVPGFDFLAVAALAVVVLTGASFLFRKKNTGA